MGFVSVRERTANFDREALWRELDYNPTDPNVLRFHKSGAKTKIAVCPRRAGKSYSAAKDVLPDVLVPNTRGWIVGPNYGLAEKEFRVIYEDLALKLSRKGLPRPTTAHTKASTGLLLKFPWGSIVEGKSADRPESLLGEAVDWIIYSEGAQLPRAIRDRYLAPTLMTTKGREIIPTTPDAKAEWLYELWEKGMGNDYPEIESYSWPITANPTYPIEEFELMKKQLGADSPAFREQYLGEWVFYTGLVYSTFSPEYNVIEPFEIPANWPKYRGIDPGHRDPFVCLWMAVGPAGELYFYREYYSRPGDGERSVPSHVDNIRTLSGAETYRQTVIDPSGAQVAEDMSSRGFATLPANNDRQAGRMRVVEYMTATDDGPKPFPFKDLETPPGRKFPRLYIFSNCVETLEELKFYRWKEGRDVEGDKEKTEGADHSVDCLRYICMERPSPFQAKKSAPVNSFNWWIKSQQAAKKVGQRQANLRRF